jgi:hypothetical protein
MNKPTKWMNGGRKQYKSFDYHCLIRLWIQTGSKIRLRALLNGLGSIKQDLMFKKKLLLTKKFFVKLSLDEFRRQVGSSTSWFAMISCDRRISISN